MKRTMLAILTAAVFCIPVPDAGAQCNPTCQGDLNLDGQVTVAEIIVAVNNALQGCSATPEQLGCIASGGTVSTGPCCTGAPDFPDTCSIGSCGCAPQFSSDVSICNCGSGTCFSRDQRACVSQ